MVPASLATSARWLVDMAGRAIARILPGKPPQRARPAGAPFAAAKAVEVPLHPTTRASIARLNDSPDFADRVRAARALGDAHEPESTVVLVRALRDRSSEVAVQAAKSLARHGGRVAVDALGATLRNEDGYASTETRAAAVDALGTILPANEGSQLIAAVADADASVSLAAIAALARRDESASVQALMGVLEDRGAYYLPVTRHAAARALSRLNRGDSPRMRALLDGESDPEVRRALEPVAARS